MSCFISGTLRIAVTGSRELKDENIVIRTYESLIQEGARPTIVHGGCRGTDLLCEKVAKEKGYITEEFKAEWKAYGKMAGPIRNKQMLSSGIDILVAFPGGKGTKNCIQIARELGIPIFHAYSERWEHNGEDASLETNLKTI